MAEPFLGEIKPFAFNFAPKGWALCNGQTLPINENAALFSLLGTFYGGNGQTTFQLPNLQGACVIGMSSSYSIGSVGGEASHTLVSSEMPQHTHLPLASATAGNSSSPISNYPAAAAINAYYSSSPSTPAYINSAAVGGSQPHENRQPFLVINFCIALSGIFPTRN